MSKCLRTLFACLALGPGIAHGEPDTNVCTVDRERLLALNPQAFDQDMKGGWRKLAENPQCRAAAADLIRDYRNRHENEWMMLIWHEGQMRADVGQTAEAIALFEQCRTPSSSSPGWNQYVDATIAFLRQDRKAFEAARAALSRIPEPPGFHAKDPAGRQISWPLNLAVVDGLGRCFGLPYREAYGNCPIAAGAPRTPLTVEDMKGLAARHACEASASGVVFAGDSAQLDACLKKLGKTRGPIDELRITSRGGSAGDTLRLARELRGRLDLLVVDGLCASSCANYLLPAAKRIRVEPHSYVLLHGSLSRRDAVGQREEIRRQVREIARTQPWGKDMSEAELDQTTQQSIDAFDAGLEAQIPMQEAFARETLACDDWLDVWAHFEGQKPPAGTAWLLVTPDMAARCLSSAKVEAFWAPEAQEAFDARLGFFRALK